MSAVYVKNGNEYIDITGKNLAVVKWTKYYNGDPYQGYGGYEEEFVAIKAGEDTIWYKQTALRGQDVENAYNITEETMKEAHRIVQELIKKMGVIVNL